MAAWGERALNARRVRLAGQILLAVSLIFISLRLRQTWRDNRVNLGQVSWAFLVGAIAVTAVATTATGFIWLSILRRLGTPTHWRWVGVFFQAQLGKYIPGAVWHYAGRATLAHTRSIPLRVVGLSVSAELAASLSAAAAVAALLLGDWGILLAAVLIGIAGLGGRLREGRLASRPGVSAALASVPMYAAVWVVIGVGFWLTARALVSIPYGDLVIYVGAFSAAWVVGLVAVFAPGGIGVREAVLVALLHGRLGTADALIVAAVSRVVLTVVDLAAAGVAVLIRSRNLEPPAPVSAIPDGGLASDAPTRSAAGR
jgi:glycosyltransferase 2 family protein